MINENENKNREEFEPRKDEGSKEGSPEAENNAQSEENLNSDADNRNELDSQEIENEEEPVSNTVSSLKKKKRGFFGKLFRFIRYAVVIFILLILVLIGFTQTATFREILREKIVEIANDELRGKLSIDKIEGTIFTNLTILGAKLEDSAGIIIDLGRITIEPRISQLLSKTIEIKNLEIENLFMNLQSDSNGELNLIKALPVPTEKEDSVKTKFGFTIRVINLEIKNFDLVHQTYKYSGLDTFYINPNFEDLIINDLALKLSAEAKLFEDRINLDIKSFTFKPNFKYIEDINVKMALAISKEGIILGNLNLLTSNSNLNFTGNVSGINVFEFDSTFADKAQFELEMNAAPFAFLDLETFVEGLDYLKGDLKGDIKIEGNLNDIYAEKIELRYGTTELNAKARITDMFNDNGMFIKSIITNSVLNTLDINRIMPSLELADYSKEGVVYVDSLSYYGSGNDFFSGFSLRQGQGLVEGYYTMDFLPASNYKAEITTSGFNAEQYLFYPVILNSKLSVQGRDFNPNNLTATIEFFGDGSIVSGNMVENLSLKANIVDGYYNINLNLEDEEQTIAGILELFYKDPDNPTYKLNANVQKLDISKFVDDSTMSSDINFVMTLEGSGFDPEKINLTSNLDMAESSVNGERFGVVKAVLKIAAKEDDSKQISLISNLLNFEVAGKFKYNDLTNAIISESDSLNAVLNERMSRYFPENLIDSIKIIPLRPIQYEINPFELTYKTTINNLDPFKQLFKDFNIKLDGSLSGGINYKNKIFTLTSTANIQTFELSDTLKTTLIYDSKSEISYIHDQKVPDYLKFTVDFGTVTRRVYYISEGSVTTLKEITANFNVNKEKLDLERIRLQVNDNISLNIAAVSDFEKDSLFLDIYQIKLKYNNFEVENAENIILSFTGELLKLTNFNLGRKKAILRADILMGSNYIQSMTASLKGLTARDVMINLLELDIPYNVDSDLSFNFNLSGPFDNPSLTANFEADNMRFGALQIGYFYSDIEIIDKVLKPNLVFRNRKNITKDSLFLITGNIPFDFSFTDGTNEVMRDQPTELQIIAQNFALRSLEKFIPNIQDLSGLMQGKINFTGNFPDLNRTGFMSIENGSFMVSMTQLTYKTEMMATLSNDAVNIQKFVLQNTDEVKNVGTITGSGKINLSGFDFAGMNVKLRGDLTILDNYKPSRDLAFYGRMYVKSVNDIDFTATSFNSFLRANIQVAEADLIFPPMSGSYSGASSNFKYIYKEDAKKDSIDLELENAIKISESQQTFLENQRVGNIDFGMETRISLDNNSKMTFIFSQESNQKLIALLKGDLVYTYQNQNANIQGELRVQDGSTLEFLNLKTFKAGGTIKFESEIMDPNLDISAVYQSYYIFRNGGADVERPVQVKIKIKGPYSDLASNFMRSDDNIAVYVGEENIENENPSPEYDKADAVWFIITGKFKNDLTAQDKSSAASQINIVQGTATSLAGSLLGSLLSSYLGEFVQSVEIRSVGAKTKFNLSGQVSNVKYSFGGDTNLFEDFSSATFRVDVPLQENFLLRIERRENISEGSTIGQMINELGLKYRFKF